MDEIPSAVETLISYDRALSLEEQRAVERALMDQSRKEWAPTAIPGLVCWMGFDDFGKTGPNGEHPDFLVWKRAQRIARRLNGE